jgi:ketosteroid isomerase-like protein
MTPKEVVQKGYDCFASGDMETFVKLFHEDCTVTINGMHKFSGTCNGINEFMDLLALIPSHYDNFSVTVANMISEGDQVATQLDASADGMEAKFGHFHRIEGGKIKEFWIYDDSQKMAHAMKAV